MKRAAVTAVTLLLMTGCSGTDRPTEKAEALPKVSAATTCGQLFDDEAPIEEVIDLMQKPTTSPADANRARDFADELEPIGSQADGELAPHVEVVIDELRTFADSVDDLKTYDTGSMVTSLTELNNVCGLTPRF